MAAKFATGGVFAGKSNSSSSDKCRPRLQLFVLLCGGQELEFCCPAALFVAPQLRPLLRVVNFPNEQFLLRRFCAARDDCHWMDFFGKDCTS